MKAAQTVRDYALTIVSAMRGVIELVAVIERIAECLADGCRMNGRKKEPNTYQLPSELDNVA